MFTGVKQRPTLWIFFNVDSFIAPSHVCKMEASLTSENSQEAHGNGRRGDLCFKCSLNFLGLPEVFPRRTILGSVTEKEEANASDAKRPL